MNGAKLKEQGQSFRGFLVGYPSAGKTGAIASLLNAGYMVRVIDFEGNLEPLINFANPKALKNLDVVTVRDRFELQAGDKHLTVTGTPSAFNRALGLAKHWKYKEDGVDVDLGKSRDWGRDTVLVVDSLTAMAEAAMERAMGYSNATPSYIPPAAYGSAVADLTKAIKLMGAEDKQHHFIMLGHLRMLGPDDYLKMDEKDSKKHPELEGVLKAKLEAIDAQMLPVRLYPVGATKNHSQLVHKELPIMLRAEQVTIGGKNQRVIWTRTNDPLDLKFPMPGVKERYPLETGLAQLFETMGHKAPGLE